MVQTADILKQWFETGDTPTQQQFADLIDSCINGAIAVGDVAGLTALLNLKLDKSVFDAYEQGQLINIDTDYTYSIPAGYLLEKIIMFYGADGTFIPSKTGYNNTDLLDEPINYVAGWQSPIQLDIVAIDVTNLFLAGIPNGSKVLIIKRKIKTN